LNQNPPCTTRLVPINIEQCPFLGHGAGPVVYGFDQAIISKSKTYTSLKKSYPFHPPNTIIFVPPTRLEV
jgi:hypothetical protein